MKMKIEIKNLVYSERLSEETLNFKADIYVNGVKTAYANNEGHGGPTNYRAYPHDANELLKKAEAWAASQPPVKSEELKFEFPMTFEYYIDEAVNTIVTNKKYAKDFAKGVCFGNKSAYQCRYIIKHPIAKLLETEKGREALIKLVKDVQANLKAGESILNTNLPEDIYKPVAKPATTEIFGEVLAHGLTNITNISDEDFRKMHKANFANKFKNGEE